MTFITSLYSLILYASAILCLIVSILSWKRRPAFGSIPLCILLGAVSFWSFFQSFVFLSDSFPVKLVLADMRYIGIELIPLSFIAFVYEHTKHKIFFNLKRVICFLIPSFIFFIIIMTNKYHYFFYSSTYIREDGILILVNNTGFWLNIVYIYAFMAIGLAMLFVSQPSSQNNYRKQTKLILISTIIPLIANMLFNFNLIPSGELDLTPLFFSSTGLLFFYSLFRSDFLSVSPIAKDELFENLFDPVIVVDKNKVIIEINKQGAKLFQTIIDIKHMRGYVGKSTDDVFNLMAEFKEKLNNPHELDEEIQLLIENQSRYFIIQKKRIVSKSGQFKGDLVVLRDITELKKALLDAKSMQTTAELANKAKSIFLANMSHEIRTPMNAIIGISDILYSTNLPPEEQKKSLKTLMSSAMGLLALLNDILDYSKIEAGKLDLEKIVFNLNELLEEVINTFSLHADNKGLFLKYKLNGKLPVYLTGDPSRIKQIIVNLISNAMKFTEEGGINVIVEVCEIIESKIILSFIVTDTGVGISEEKTEMLFESFKQLDSSTTRKYGGTGLGLAIVKNLVEIMGGKIKVESSPGKGSSFIFKLPLEIPNEVPVIVKTESAVINNQIIGDFSLIIAEDNKVNQEIMKLMLTKKGINADFADNGRDLLKMLEIKKYDMILMDMQMPEKDGIEATKEIRKKEIDTKLHMTIIALTANALSSDKERCFTAGMDDYLSKPLRYKELSEMIDKYLIQI